MAHLNQRQISEKSCKAIIIDTILESVTPLTQSELSDEILYIFHILVSPERLNKLIKLLNSDGIIHFDSNERIVIDSVKEAEFIKARQHGKKLRQDATTIWLEYVSSIHEISSSLKVALSQSLPVFLRTLFINHGVSSYKLLISSEVETLFDIKGIAASVSRQVNEDVQRDVETLLPTIFQTIGEPKVLEYLTHSINKAVGYISEVISEENYIQIKDGLKRLTLYLDTNVIYRLLGLQGKARLDSIRETLSFCIANGVDVRVSAQTCKELSARLKYDAKVLRQFPTPTDLAAVGYRYRTSDNYISAFWQQARTAHLSVEDFIAYYQNYDLILTENNISLEQDEINNDSLVTLANSLYEKMSKRDIYREKSEPSLWHDAYNLAYVKNNQRITATTAIDTGCLFLTTDHALASFQREDYELKEGPPIAIAPTQLLQLFSFSTPDLGYEETFIKFFASSSLGLSFEYDNGDIQEILHRISHYQGTNQEIASKILGRQLISQQYFAVTTDAEKEEIIYNNISEELLRELDKSKAQVSSLTAVNTQLTGTHEATLDLIEKNKSLYELEKSKLQEEASMANQLLEEETTARIQAEEKERKTAKYSAAQEELYVDEKWQKWRRNHLWMFWTSGVSIIVIILLSIYLWRSTFDTTYFGLLALLAVPIGTLPFGCKVFSAGVKSEIKQKFLNDYKDKLKK